MNSHPTTPHEGPHDMDEGDLKDYWDAYWAARDSQHVASSTPKEGADAPEH